VIDVATGVEALALKPGDGYRPVTLGVGLSRDGSLVARVVPERLQVWDVESGAQRANLALGTEGRCLAFSAGGRVAAGRHDGRVLVYDLDRDERSCFVLDAGEIGAVEFSATGREVLVATCDGAISLADVGAVSSR